MDSLIKQYEWDNRLGTISYTLKGQANNLSSFIDTFKDRLDIEDIRDLRIIADKCQELGQDVSIIERRYDA